MDFKQYQDPGVYLEEIPSPVVATPIIAPTVVALIGDSRRYRVATEVIQLSGTTPVQLKNLGILLTSIVVKDQLSGVTYAQPGDYTRAAQNGADGLPSTADDTSTVTRVGGGTIPDGGFVSVTYQYTDPTYYDAKVFDDFDDISEQYGPMFDSSGAIDSELTLGAFLAFQQGATSLICVAIKADTAPEWTAALEKLENDQSVNVIVPLTGNEAYHDLVFTHVKAQELQGNLRRGFVGQDGTATAITDAVLIAWATSYRHTRMVVVAPTVFTMYEGGSAQIVRIGGQYAAAAVAGLHAAQPAQEPLTRKQIFGFYSIPSQGTNTKLITLQREGVLVLFQRRDSAIIVRHGVTTMGPTGSKYTQEISVVAAKDRLHDLLESTLDNQGLVGTILNDTTPDFVESTVIGALQLAKDVDLIQDFTNVKWRIPSDAPTVIEIRFEYQASMPLNYVLVQFALDTGTGEVVFGEEELFE